MSKFVPGQIWTYATRPNEESSRVVILKVEEDDTLGTVVHIRVSGLRIPSPSAPGGQTDQIGHMPFSEDALSRSLLKLESTSDAIPDFQEGYQQWRSAVDSGKGGIFTIDVVDGVKFIAEAMQPK